MSLQVERIIFCVFLERDLKIYRKKLHQYFPEEIDEQSQHAGNPTEEEPDEARERDSVSPSEAQVGGSDGFVPGLNRAATEPGTVLML